MRGGSRTEGECAKENKHRGMLKRKNDRRNVSENVVPGLTPAPRLGCSTVFETHRSVSGKIDVDGDSSVPTQDISNMSASV